MTDSPNTRVWLVVCQPLDVTSHLDFFECSSYSVNIVKGKSRGRKPGDPGSSPSSASSLRVTWESHSPLPGHFPAGQNQATFQVILLLSAHVSISREPFLIPRLKQPPPGPVTESALLASQHLPPSELLSAHCTALCASAERPSLSCYLQPRQQPAHSRYLRNVGLASEGIT